MAHPANTCSPTIPVPTTARSSAAAATAAAMSTLHLSPFLLPLRIGFLLPGLGFPLHSLICALSSLTISAACLYVATPCCWIMIASVALSSDNRRHVRRALETLLKSPWCHAGSPAILADAVLFQLAFTGYTHAGCGNDAVTINYHTFLFLKADPMPA